MGNRLAAGDLLPGVTHQITTEMMIAFESVLWNRGSTAHNDPATAITGGMKRPFASGQTMLAFVHEMLERTFGVGWIEGGRTSLRWLRPLYAGDIISVRGEVEGVAEKGREQLVHVKIWAENQSGERCAAGHAVALQSPGARQGQSTKHQGD